MVRSKDDEVELYHLELISRFRVELELLPLSKFFVALVVLCRIVCFFVLSFLLEQLLKSE